MSESSIRPRGGRNLARVVLLVAFLGLLVTQRHRLVGAIREFSLLPGSVDRAEAAAARVRPLLEAELAAMGLMLGNPVYLRVLKEEQVMEVWMQPSAGADFVHYKTYVLCRPGGVAGPRVGEQEQQLPEGYYGVSLYSLRPQHRHYLAFEIGYPNALDHFHRRPGRRVFVQGDCVSGGALALSNPNMEEVYTVVAAALHAGQETLPVHLFPFQLTDSKMNEMETADTPWLEFWGNLKEGYDYFEILRRPPRTTVKAGRYCFE